MATELSKAGDDKAGAERRAVEARAAIVSRVTAGIVALIALLILVTSLIHDPALEAAAKGLFQPAIPTAICFLLAGGVLAGLGLPAPGRKMACVVRGVGLCVFLVGTLALVAYQTGWNNAIGRFMTTTPGGNDPAARMAITTAVNFVLIGLGLAFYSHGARAPLGQSFVGVMGFIAWLTLVGYAYDLEAIYEMGTRSVGAVMAVQTAAAFLLLEVAYFLAQPRSGVTAILLSQTVTGSMTRRLLPVAFFVPAVLGWLRLAGEQRGYYGTAVGVALFALVLTVVMTAVILASARQLHIEEETRKRLENARHLADRQVAEQARLLDLTFDAIIVRDSQERITYWNRGASELYGWTREEALGRVSHELLGTQFPEPRDRLLARVYRDGRWSGEVVHTCRDGERVIVFTRWSLDRDSRGQPASILETNNDITAAKKVEAELRESRGKLELLDNLSEATRTVDDPREIMTIVARRVGEHLQVSRCAYADVESDAERFSIQGDYTNGCASTVGDYQLSLFGPRAAAKMRAGRTLVISDMDHELAPGEGGEMFNALGIKAIICCPLVKEGALRAMMAVHHGTPRRWTPAEVALMEAVVERSWAYIERARAEAALRDNEQQLRSIADAMPALVAYVDQDLRYRFANAEYRSWFDTGPEGVTGKHVREVLGETVAAQVMPHVQRALAGEDVRFETQAQYRHGSRWIDAHYVPHRDEHGQVLGLFVLVLDITDRKSAEAQLARAKEDLERQVQERTASLRDTIAQLETFSYSITHDMRGPLRAMVSFAQILQADHDQQLTSEGREYLRRIFDAARRLDRLIQDVLQYSRMARETLPMEPINIERLLHDIVHQYPDIVEHVDHITIETLCADRLVQANPAALTQVISNLIGNALKFVPPGRTPQVMVRCEERGGRIRVTVRDNGVGVPADQQEKIFGVFQRLHGSEYAGTGIGLSIVKKAIERMGGAVGVESQVGRGSEFWIELARAEQVAAMVES